MSEEASETNTDRFQMETVWSAAGMILIIDTNNPTTRVVVGSYHLADSLAAGEYAARLNRRHEMGIEDVFGAPLMPTVADGGVPTRTPSQFLAETLPAYARIQQQDAEAVEVEREALKMIREGAEILNRITVVREKLSASLTALGASQSAENASGVGVDTPERLGPDLGVFRNPEVYSLNKPGPY